MAYKYSKGSRGLGDITFEDDADTGIDFEADTVKLETGGAERLVVTNTSITMTGEIIVDEYIKHNGDTDTFIKFTDDIVILKAGNKSMFRGDPTAGKIYINNGGHDLDFMVRDTSSGALLYTDAGNARVGIGTDVPDYTLDVAGDIGVDHKIYHNGDANTYINFTDDRIRFDAGGMGFIGMHKKDSAPHQVTINNGNNNIDFVVNSNNNSNDPVLRCDASAASVGIRTASPIASLHVDGSFAGKASVISSYPHTVSSTDYIILATGTASPVRKVTLPAVSGQQGRIIIVKDASGNAGSNGLEVDGNGSETIDGSADKLINSNYGFLVFVCGASEWHVIGQ